MTSIASHPAASAIVAARRPRSCRGRGSRQALLDQHVLAVVRGACGSSTPAWYLVSSATMGTMPVCMVKSSVSVLGVLDRRHCRGAAGSLLQPGPWSPGSPSRFRERDRRSSSGPWAVGEDHHGHLGLARFWTRTKAARNGRAVRPLDGSCNRAGRGDVCTGAKQQGQEAEIEKFHCFRISSRYAVHYRWAVRLKVFLYYRKGAPVDRGTPGLPGPLHRVFLQSCAQLARRNQIKSMSAVRPFSSARASSPIRRLMMLAIAIAAPKSNLLMATKAPIPRVGANAV